MQGNFETVHRDQIQGTLTTVDRLIVHGHLRSFWHNRGAGLATFLIRQGVPVLKGFGGYVHAASEKVRLHASEIASRAGRPFIYQDRVVRGKDALAREIAKRDGVSQGLICVFSTLELATCFALVQGRIAPRLRKCLHFYFYLIDPELGFMHVRLQSWFPFQIQVYVNGREWLGRQLTKKGIGHVRYENTFVHIDDLRAQRICETFSRRRWWKRFDAFARRANPLLPLIEKLGFGPYYWAIDACEVATDVMWDSRKHLRRVLDDLFDYALRTFSADDVVRFLGYKFQPSKAEVASYHQRFPAEGDTVQERRRRPECRRLKHRIRHNWIKLYDKWSVLRVETVINRPYDFRTLRVERDRRGRKRYCYVAMTKSLHNLWRFIQVGEAANRRYLNALAVAKPIKRTIADLDSLCRGRTVGGVRCPRINPVAPDQHQVFQAVLAGEHAIQGLRNRDLRARLYSVPAKSPTEAKSRCSRVSRIITKLRGHGLLANTMLRIAALASSVVASMAIVLPWSRPSPASRSSTHVNTAR